MSNLWEKLFGIVKFILPFLRSAAEKSFKQLPKDQQESLKNATRIVQVIKKLMEAKKTVSTEQIEATAGMPAAEILLALNIYLKAKGKYATTLSEALEIISEDIKELTETGLKAYWNGFASILANIVANIEWEAVVMGLVEFVYRTYVRGKIKL